MRRQLRPRRMLDGLRFGISSIPIAIAVGFMQARDVPWFFDPVLVVFGAVLPLLAIGFLATVAVNNITERQARRLVKPRPRATYLFLALGWAVATAVFRLLGWAAGGGPDGVGDWIVTAIGWSFMISLCAALLMITRAITAGSGLRGRGMAWRAAVARPEKR